MAAEGPVRAVSAFAARVAEPPLNECNDDRVIVERIRLGDEAAFETLFRAHYAGLLRFATALTGDEGRAEELVQDVFARIWSTRGRWEVRNSVPTYLYGAVRNGARVVARHERVVDRWRKKAGNATDAQVFVGPRVASSDERLETRELGDVVAATIAALPKRCRQTYILSRQGDLSYADIAKVMGTSVRTVDAQMGRAFAALRRAVARWRA